MDTILEIIEGEELILVGNVSTIGEFGFCEGLEIYKVGLKDAGTVSIGGFKEAADAGQAKVIELHGSGEDANFKITYPDGATAEFSGTIKSFMFSDMETGLSWSVDVRISGGVTYTDAHWVSVEDEGEPYKKIKAERDRQDKKWGVQNHMPQYWAGILGEEYGELCEAINETVFNNGPEERGGYENIMKEACHVAAVAVAIMECMTRNRESWFRED